MKVSTTCVFVRVSSTADGTNGETLLGAMDYSLLFAYAVGTYVRYEVVTCFDSAGMGACLSAKRSNRVNFHAPVLYNIHVLSKQQLLIVLLARSNNIAATQ